MFLFGRTIMNVVAMIVVAATSVLGGCRASEPILTSAKSSQSGTAKKPKAIFIAATSVYYPRPLLKKAASLSLLATKISLPQGFGLQKGTNIVQGNLPNQTFGGSPITMTGKVNASGQLIPGSVGYFVEKNGKYVQVPARGDYGYGGFDSTSAYRGSDPEKPGVVPGTKDFFQVNTGWNIQDKNGQTTEVWRTGQLGADGKSNGNQAFWARDPSSANGWRQLTSAEVKANSLDTQFSEQVSAKVSRGIQDGSRTFTLPNGDTATTSTKGTVTTAYGKPNVSLPGLPGYVQPNQSLPGYTSTSNGPGSPAGAVGSVSWDGTKWSQTLPGGKVQTGDSANGSDPGRFGILADPDLQASGKSSTFDSAGNTSAGAAGTASGAPGSVSWDGSKWTQTGFDGTVTNGDTANGGADPARVGVLSNPTRTSPGENGVYQYDDKNNLVGFKYNEDKGGEQLYADGKGNFVNDDKSWTSNINNFSADGKVPEATTATATDNGDPNGFTTNEWWNPSYLNSDSDNTGSGETDSESSIFGNLGEDDPIYESQSNSDFETSTTSSDPEAEI